MQWCLEFCDFNNTVSRPLLVDTIRYSYIRHRENQRYFARAIRELKPVFEALSEQVETFVRVLMAWAFHSRIASSPPSRR